MSESSTVTSDTVLAEQRGGVRVLTLNRPDRLNAFNDELQERYFALLAEADDDPDVRAIVVTGAGKGFCAGADMAKLEATAGGQAPQPATAQRRDVPRGTRKPLIGAINGAAAGIGLLTTLYCDVRFTVPRAKFTTAFARRGLIAEYAMSWLLPRLVGPSHAMDLLISGRVIDGEEALRMGLVNRVVAPEELLDTAVAYGQDLADHCSPTSMAVIKQQVLDDLEAGYEESFQRSLLLAPEAFARPDLREGVDSYLEKRPPVFPPLAAG
jgi:enoyl-CoA hydratase/carnithine racemase